ncbi:MAG: DegV family protein [Clostridiales bacterium]|nr:DegV family protein [Clostridiales bacterium]
MKIAVTLDSACDLTKEIIEEYDFKIIPFGVNMGDRFFYDGEVSTLEIFEWADQNKQLPKTNAVNEEAFKDFFAEILKEYDAIIHFDISADMSSAYNNAVNASKNFNNVFVIDSRTLSTGIGLLAIYAKTLTETIDDPKQIVELVEKRIPFVQASFVLERLDYLHRGGRCSSVALLGANLLKIRPQIEVMNGKMGSTNKFRGKMGKCVTEYCNAVLSKYNNPDKAVIFITHSHATDEMINSAKDIVYELGFKKVYVTTAGCTISSHCGKNTLGILYINDGLTK